MSCVLYRGKDKIEKILVEPHDLQNHLNTGWRLTPEASYENGEDSVQGEEEAPEDEEEEKLRQEAKEAGIKHWHVKAIETLRAELSAIEG